MPISSIDMSTLSETTNNEKDVTASGIKLGNDVHSIAHYATKPAAAIARLAAGDMLEDKFGNYERISIEDLVAELPPLEGNPVIVNNFSLDFSNGKITLPGDTDEQDFHPLIYIDKTNGKIIIETRGLLMKIDYTYTAGTGTLTLFNRVVYNPRDNIDLYTNFCSENGIDETTKLGMTILLKQFLVSEGYDIAELDKVMADPQPEALAFYQQIISPALEAMITLAMTSFKKFAEFIKQIINGSMKG